MNLKNCPKCKTKGSIRQILYGMPDFDNLPDPKKYLMAGCIVTGNDPTHQCLICGWQRFPKEPDFLAKPDNSGMDEIWQDFYATLDPKLFEDPPKASPIWEKLESRKKLIHFAYMYNEVASTGTKSPVYELASRIGCSVEEVGELVNECLELRLLVLPKPGSFRCELSMLAVRMIGSMGIGR